MADKHKKQNNVENDEITAKRSRNDSIQDQQTDQSSCSYQVCEQRGNWMSLYDTASGYFYYQNTKTFQTQWEKPSNWNNLPPVFNPWVKMKYAQSNLQLPRPVTEETKKTDKLRSTGKDIEEKLQVLMKRPARRQVDLDEKKKVHWIPEGTTEYNIWYDKWVGEHWRPDGGPAETRCCIEDDAGFTKANVLDPKTNKHYFCLYFAKGCCHLGSECGFLHSLPVDKDERRIGLALDCFGRDRHLNHKENLGGVGSFEKDCTTLYIGGLGNRKAVEEELWEEFGEWGEIEDIRVINKLNIAFVRYKNRVNAEFAKVAMADQKLYNKDLLNVRWANDDPNPRACIKEQERAQDKLLEAAYERGIIQELESQEQYLGGEGITAAYPNTDHQYSNHEYWAWYQQTVGATDDRCHDYQQHSGSATQTESTGPIIQHQTEQAQTFQNVHEDCSRLDRIFQKIESKDTINRVNICPEPGTARDAKESENRNKCDTETKHNVNELDSATGNKDLTASNKIDTSTNFKDPYR